MRGRRQPLLPTISAPQSAGDSLVHDPLAFWDTPLFWNRGGPQSCLLQVTQLGAFGMIAFCDLLLNPAISNFLSSTRMPTLPNGQSVLPCVEVELRSRWRMESE